MGGGGLAAELHLDDPCDDPHWECIHRHSAPINPSPLPAPLHRLGPLLPTHLPLLPPATSSLASFPFSLYRHHSLVLFTAYLAIKALDTHRTTSSPRTCHSGMIYPSISILLILP